MYPILSISSQGLQYKDDSSDNENEDEENRSVPNSKWTYDGRGAEARVFGLEKGWY